MFLIINIASSGWWGHKWCSLGVCWVPPWKFSYLSFCFIDGRMWGFGCIGMDQMPILLDLVLFTDLFLFCGIWLLTMLPHWVSQFHTVPPLSDLVACTDQEDLSYLCHHAEVAMHLLCHGSTTQHAGRYNKTMEGLCHPLCFHGVNPLLAQPSIRSLEQNFQNGPATFIPMP